MFIVSSSEVSGEVPGLQSVATAIGTPCLRKSSTGGRFRLAQEVERARQKHRDRSGRRHGRDAGFVRVFEMIGGQRAETGRQPRAASVGQLIGMQLDWQIETPRRVEHARDLLGREGDAFAEAIHRVDEALARRATGSISRRPPSI